MAFKIFKYEVKLDSVGGTFMPKGARILSVQVQSVIIGYARRETVMVWALIDDREERSVRRLIACYGTGHPLPSSDPGKFIGTVQLQDGALVLHFFDGGEDRN